MKSIKGMVTSFSKFLDLIGGYFYLALMLLIVFNVIMRTAFSKPFIGTVELVEVFSAVAVGLTISYCAVLDEHVSIDFILNYFPTRFQKAVTLVGWILSLGFLGTVSWMMYQYGNSVRLTGRVTATMGIGYHPFVYIIALGFFVYFLVALIRIFEVMKRGIE